MLDDPTCNLHEIALHAGPCKAERAAQLKLIDSLLHKLRAALMGLGRQLGQLVVARHRYGREGKMPEITWSDELITDVGYSPTPIIHVWSESALRF